MAVQKPESKWWTYFVIFLLVFLIAVIAWRAREAYFSLNNGEGQNESGKDEGKTYCTAQSREGDVCISIYQPVCGWFDSGKVQCIAYPCATTYGNSCEACHNEGVEYWMDGECPSRG